MGRLLVLFLVAVLLPSPFVVAKNAAQKPTKITNKDIEEFAESFGIQPGSVDEDRLNRFARRGINTAKTWDDLDSMAVDADLALSRMIKLASMHLRLKGKAKEAKALSAEFNAQWQGYFSASINAKGVGDHAPLIDWLDRWYVKMEDFFGTKFMEMTRLKDIKTFNFTIPVVFQPKGEGRFEPFEPWERDDYVEHFVPFAGAVTYWATWGACTAGTWGLGWITFTCSWAGAAAEHIVMAKMAPSLGGKIWDKYNPEQETTWRKVLRAIGL